tara:strand:- start:258 stop:485 length:228 start_codon:yes stop_codon:yes gene_type:complete
MDSWISSCNIDLDPGGRRDCRLHPPPASGARGGEARQRQVRRCSCARHSLSQQQQAPPQQAPPQQVIEQMSHEHF